MSRRLPLLVAAVAALAPPTAASAGFTSGVASSESTPTSAIVWTRAPRVGRLAVELSRSTRFRGRVPRLAVVARAADDRTVTLRVAGLRPATRYAFRFRQGNDVSAVGHLRTAPRTTSTAPVEFAYSGDADGTRDPRTGRPAFNRFQVYARMAAEGNDFNINLGDTIYSDSSVGGRPAARTVGQKWAKYRENLSLPALRRLRAAAPLFNHWDDHEFINDFSQDEHGGDLYVAGARAFLDYSAVRGLSPTLGIYRRARWGRNLELFFLDERSFRDGKASAGDTCDNPATGAPDLAPTAPPALRSVFAALVPALARPVAPACLEEIRDPSRTMLGQAQLEEFAADVRRSTATFKVIVNEVPIQQFYALPYDRWEGYEAERQRVLELLRGVDNVVFLTTDAHATLVGEVRTRTLEPGGPVGTGILEAVTGPVATTTYARQVDRIVGREGFGTLLNSLFLKVPPPSGVGMSCVATDVYSYAQVRVTSTTLTITPKDLNGRLVRDTGGGPCGPFVVTAR